MLTPARTTRTTARPKKAHGGTAGKFIRVHHLKNISVYMMIHPTVDQSDRHTDGQSNISIHRAWSSRHLWVESQRWGRVGVKSSNMRGQATENRKWWQARREEERRDRHKTQTLMDTIKCMLHEEMILALQILCSSLPSLWSSSMLHAGVSILSLWMSGSIRKHAAKSSWMAAL